MACIVSVSETRSGCVNFNTEEEAKEWMADPDFDKVDWTDYLDSNMILITD